MKIAYSKNINNTEDATETLQSALVNNEKEFPYFTHAQSWQAPDLSEITEWCESPNVLVCGVGGSDLGTRALYRALKKEGKSEVFFIGDTTDPEATKEVLIQIPTNQPLAIILTSKSGKSLEPISACATALEYCEAENIDHKLIFITDEGNGPLVQNQNLANLLITIPQEIGGRFSVFTAVGLVPLLLAGYQKEVHELINGATDIDENAAQEIATLAEILSQAHEDEFANQTMITYDYKLELMGEWWKQLIGESLGKNEGITQTPITAKGPTDQHSQLQRWAEGAKNTLIITLSANRTEDARTFPSNEFLNVLYEDITKKNAYQILHAQMQGTMESLKKQNVPVLSLEIEATPKEIGAFMMQWFLTTWLIAQKWNVNPYGQPGVEEGKHVTRQLINAMKK